MPPALPVELADLLDRLHVVALPMRVRFRGIMVREVALIDGPAGWGEFGATSMIGHGEFSSRKIDPALDMGHLRTRVHALMMGTGEEWCVTVAGDTLWSLSRRYGVTVDQIKRLNNLQSDLIGVGWRLRME